MNVSLSTEPPTFVTNEPTQVKIGMYVNQIKEVDHKEMKMTMSAYLRLSWNDPRLEFDSAEYNNQESLKMPDGAWKQIWTPDIFMRNNIANNLHSTVREHVLLKISNNGGIWLVLHTTFTVGCPMRLQRYPFDTQTCPIMFESFGYTMDDIVLLWLTNPFQIAPSISLAGYTLEKTILYDCSQNYTGGAFPCLETRLILRRNTGCYYLTYFIPTMIAVVVSFFSFWVDVEQYAYRILVNLLMLMILMIQYGIANSEVAHVSYTKALDIWMLICLLFLFLAMVQATLVKGISGLTPNSNSKKGEDGDEKVGDYAMLLGRVYSPSSIINMIDIVARVLFPVLFLLTIIIYFSLFSA